VRWAAGEWKKVCAAWPCRPPAVLDPCLRLGRRGVLWPLKLHSFGLLNNSFQPTDEIRIACTPWRQRGSLVAEASSVIQCMQKVLTEMNIQLSNVLSDLIGVSSMKIIGAILEGERNPWELASLLQPGRKPPGRT